MPESIRLTQYSHGAGCGCKIAPDVLETILHSELDLAPDPRLLVGHASKDDAAVYDLGNGSGVISTTDFFMPIVDDPFDFGRIAATNAMSDVYAMGGRPLMAVAVLGWPLDRLPAAVAGRVVEGGRQACADAGFPLAGGHSIDAPEPIFGTAVTGLVELGHLKRNDTAEAGCLLFLTKPLGIGILTTAEKRELLEPEHRNLATEVMCLANRVGAEFGALAGVTAMTDVTGFGLLGHLLEMCEGSHLRAEIRFDAVPMLPLLGDYVEAGCVPGGTGRNHRAYGHRISAITPLQQAVLCDPQTSGGLLVAVREDGLDAFAEVACAHAIRPEPIGRLLPPADAGPRIEVIG